MIDSFIAIRKCSQSFPREFGKGSNNIFIIPVDNTLVYTEFVQKSCILGIGSRFYQCTMRASTPQLQQTYDTIKVILQIYL